MKKSKKKLTSVSFMYVCVAENAELLVFFACLKDSAHCPFRLFFEPFHQTAIDSLFKIFHVRFGKKSKSVSFSRVYVCVKAKLTLVFFFLLFFLCTFP